MAPVNLGLPRPPATAALLLLMDDQNLKVTENQANIETFRSSINDTLRPWPRLRCAALLPLSAIKNDDGKQAAQLASSPQRMMMLPQCDCACMLTSLLSRAQQHCASCS